MNAWKIALWGGLLALCLGCSLGCTASVTPPTPATPATTPPAPATREELIVLLQTALKQHGEDKLPGIITAANAPLQTEIGVIKSEVAEIRQDVDELSGRTPASSATPAGDPSPADVGLTDEETIINEEIAAARKRRLEELRLGSVLRRLKLEEKLLEKAVERRLRAERQLEDDDEDPPPIIIFPAPVPEPAPRPLYPGYPPGYVFPTPPPRPLPGKDLKRLTVEDSWSFTARRRTGRPPGL